MVNRDGWRESWVSMLSVRPDDDDDDDDDIFFTKLYIINVNTFNNYLKFQKFFFF